MKIKKTKTLFYIVLFIGLAARLFFASGSYNLDITNFIKDIMIFREGKYNIYKYFEAYNYSPIYYLFIGFVDLIFRNINITVPLQFLLRSIVSTFDVFIAILLLYFVTTKKKTDIRPLIFFFLNPVSIILSGRHGQFDNISLFFLLFAVYFYKKDKINAKIRHILIYLSIVFGFLVKHILLFPYLLMCLIYMRSRIKGIILFSSVLLIFGLSFVPFLTAKDQIVEQVIRYRGLGGLYGLSYFFYNLCENCQSFGIKLNVYYKWFFMASSFIFVLYISKLKYDILRLINITILFFMVFTPGSAAQYMVLPIAIGAIYRTKFFYFYSAITTLFLLGSVDEFGIKLFQTFSWNMVWVFSILWFFSELFTMAKPNKLLNLKILKK